MIRTTRASDTTARTGIIPESSDPPTGTAPHRILVSGIQVVEVGGAVVLLADRARLLAHMTRQEDLAIRSRNGFRHLVFAFNGVHIFWGGSGDVKSSND
jgi:hypothetical protein